MGAPRLIGAFEFQRPRPRIANHRTRVEIPHYPRTLVCEGKINTFDGILQAYGNAICGIGSQSILFVICPCAILLVDW